MASNLSSDLFLLSKALVTANAIRADIRKLENTLVTVGCESDFLDLVRAVQVSAETMHEHISNLFDKHASYVDALAHVDDMRARFNTEADKYVDDDDDGIPKYAYNKFCTGNYYKVPGDDEYFKVCARYTNEGKAHVVVRMGGKQLVLIPTLSPSKFWCGKPTEYLTIRLSNGKDSNISSTYVIKDPTK